MKKRNQKHRLAMLLCWMLLLTVISIPAIAEEAETPSCKHSDKVTREEAGKAATCNHDGNHTVITVCADCGQELSRQTVTDEAPGHRYKETARKEASCGKAGSVTYTCSRCGDHYDEEIPALKHDYQKKETDPTCTEAGKVTYTCSLCGDTYTEAGKEALGHDYKETSRKEATYDAKGSVTYTCSRCKDSYQKTLPRLERPAVPFEQTETVDGVKITVSAEAGVFDADAKLNISKTGNGDFTGAAETALGVRAGERTVISHSVYSISGAKMNGSAQAELENLKLTDLRRTYPEGRVTIYVLRYDANAQKAADRAVRVSEEANPDGNSISFDLSELGLYDVMTVTRLPEKTGTSDGKFTEESGEEAAGESGEEPGEEPTEEPAEEPAGEPAEELTENPTEESGEETAGEEPGEPGEGSLEEPTEEPTEESAEEPTGEPGEESAEEPTGEPGEESAEEPTGEPREESAEESAGKLPADPSAAGETEEQAGPEGDSETETEAEPFAVTISASYEGELCYGSEVTLTAVLSVDDPEAVVVWEYSPDGGQTVFAVEDEHSSTLTYTYSEETRDYSWRVAVNRAPVD